MLTSACPVVTLSSFEVAVTATPQGLIGSGPAGAVYVIVFVPVVAIVPRAEPEAVQTVVASGSAARVQVTAWLLVPVTVAVYCTVLGVLVLTGTDAGEAGEDATAIAICLPPPPPLPGACAMHPAKESTMDKSSRHDRAETA